MKAAPRLLVSVLGGILVILGAGWALTWMLGDHTELYQGRPFVVWCEQLTNTDASASNTARGVLLTDILPALTNRMFQDTRDSALRLALIERLNSLPGINISFTPAYARRSQVVYALGDLGPIAQPAIPALLAALKSSDEQVCGPAAAALVKVKADPREVIPVLIHALQDSAGNGRPDVAAALGAFGPRSESAVPALIKLLPDRSSKEFMEAVRVALKRIDPAAAAKAGAQ